MTDHETRPTPIWDLPTRIFHWALVVSVGLNLFLVEPEGRLVRLHFVLGYLVAALLAFRLAWGWIGSPRSRFADFVARWPRVRAHAARLARLDPPRSIGHNPLGGWMVVAMLAVLAAVVATGLLALGRDATGPFAALVPAGLARGARGLHDLFTNLLIALIVVHVLGVALDSLLTRENLVGAMWTGRRKLSPDEAAAERPLAGGARAAVLAAVLAVLTVLSIARTDFTAASVGTRSGAGTAAEDRS